MTKKIVAMISTHDSGETKTALHTEKEKYKLVCEIRHNRNMSKADLKDHLLPHVLDTKIKNVSKVP